MKLEEAEKDMPEAKGPIYIDYITGHRVVLRNVRVDNARRVIERRNLRTVVRARMMLPHVFGVVKLASAGLLSYEQVERGPTIHTKTRTVKWRSPMRKKRFLK